MQEAGDLLSTIFRKEYRKIVSVLTKLFGLEHIEIAEDIVGDTFLLATETWGKKGLPDNPTAWLYTVAKNRTKDYLKRNAVFSEKIAVEVRSSALTSAEMEVDTSAENIKNSELQMLFALCHPSIPPEAQIGLALRILFGLGIEEIAAAFLSNKETINKRLLRAKEKLRAEKIKMEVPPPPEIESRLKSVVATLYLLFNEGYYSSSNSAVLRKDICFQALYLAFLLSENEQTNHPEVNALIALMCFHGSRFAARIKNEEIILWNEQDSSLWNKELVQTGEWYLTKAAEGQQLSKYHLEAAIAYWHTQPTDSPEKWRKILDYYNVLLQIEYSPMAALNRTYALAKAESVERAIAEALKLKLETSHWYFALLGELFSLAQKNQEAIAYWNKALECTKNDRDRKVIQLKIEQIANDRGR